MLVESTEFVDKNAVMTDVEEMLLVVQMYMSLRVTKGVDYKVLYVTSPQLTSHRQVVVTWQPTQSHSKWSILTF